MASQAERQIEISTLQWTVAEARVALAQITVLMHDGVWDRPQWAQDIFDALGEERISTAITIGMQRIVAAFDSALRARGIDE